MPPNGTTPGSSTSSTTTTTTMTPTTPPSPALTPTPTPTPTPATSRAPSRRTSSSSRGRAVTPAGLPPAPAPAPSAPTKPTPTLPTGHDATLTPQQSRELERLLASLRASEPERWTGLLAAAQGSVDEARRFALRFLRATMRDKRGERVFDADAARVRLEATLDFRRAHGLDDVGAAAALAEDDSDATSDPVARAVAAATRTSPEYAAYLAHVRPRVLHVDERTGQLVHAERLGAFASRVDASRYAPEQWTRLFALDCETALVALRLESRRRGREASTMVVVADASGLALGALASSSRVDLFKRMAGVAATHFPELLSRAVVVNSPSVWSVMWSVVAPVLDPETREKLVVERGVPRERLGREWPGLPAELGGARQDVVVPESSLESGGGAGSWPWS